ncbi:MAG: hypothetical protein AAF170_18235 [Bacteroidota bacterium]
MSSRSAQRRSALRRAFSILRISLLTVAVSGLLIGCGDVEREEGLRAASSEATALRVEGDSTAGFRVLAAALTSDSAAVEGRRQWGRFTRVSEADSVAAWLAFRLAVFHVERGEADRALPIFSRIVRQPVSAVRDSMRIEAIRATVYAVTEGRDSLAVDEIERHMETLLYAQIQAERLGELTLADRVSDCRSWLRGMLAAGQRVKLQCYGDECPAPADPTGMWIAALLVAASGWWIAGWRIRHRERIRVALGSR